MELQKIYQSDINRKINGVIKVQQDEESAIEAELREYIITRELRRHFTTFLDQYAESLEEPTDQIGVWISGFFGSGKSHFLKMLSYLLSNGVVAGKHAADYFEDKFDDPMMFEKLKKCVRVSTETILFNIDSKSPIVKDKTAILRVFAKVFYEHLGFYGNDLKVAKLEQFIEKSGKTAAFQTHFQRIHGRSWAEAREAFTFIEEDVVTALTAAAVTSETVARNWFNGEKEINLSIEQLVKEIKAYIDSKGKTFRLLFLVDEVGQYIGSDSDFMLNLQTLVEEIGAQCTGRVWVMVTSQEAIDDITQINGNDFSKIQGRFNIRLSLSSSSVDEVIKRRILAKNADGTKLLQNSYEKNQMILRNLFSFRAAVMDCKGYADERDFVETYPFVPYQFQLMQQVLAEIRKHGNAGKHLSGGERSMLSGFQEAAQKIQHKDEYALVPFSLFYDTVQTFLGNSIRSVIDRCQAATDNHDGIERFDVEVLKLLYLIRYVDDIKANVDNITILMADDIRTDKVSKRLEIQCSLDRLVQQNYVSRNGETYTFLTNDEQDIAREIARMPVDSAMVTQEISNIIFHELYPSKKIQYGKYDFPYDRILDETVFGRLTGAVRLHFITTASEDYCADDNRYLMKSGHDNEAIIVLSAQQAYFAEIEYALKIERYAKSKNQAQMPDTMQAMIRKRIEEATDRKHAGKSMIAAAIKESRIYAAGEKLEIKRSGVKERIANALTALIEKVYDKLGYIRQYCDSDTEILDLLSRNKQQMMLLETDSPNADAVKEVFRYLQVQREKGLSTSMGDIQKRFSMIPYGWLEIDIAAVIAELVATEKITVSYCDSMIQPSDPKMPEYLRKKMEIDKTIIRLREKLNPTLVKNAQVFLSQYFNVSIAEIPNVDQEDTLIRYVIERLEAQKAYCSKMLAEEYSKGCYPGKEVTENGERLCIDLLKQKKDHTALLRTMVEMQNDFLDHSEDMAEVESFFRQQRVQFDKAVTLLRRLAEEQPYLGTDDTANQSLARIREILAMRRPYRAISELPEHIQQVESVHIALLMEKRAEVAAAIQTVMGEIHQAANPDQQSLVRGADEALMQIQAAAERTELLTTLDAMRIQIYNIRQQYLKQLLVTATPAVKTRTMERSTICPVTKLKNEEDVDRYIAEIKMQLMAALDGNDILQVI